MSVALRCGVHALPRKSFVFLWLCVNRLGPGAEDHQRPLSSRASAPSKAFEMNPRKGASSQKAVGGRSGAFFLFMDFGLKVPSHCIAAVVKQAGCGEDPIGIRIDRAVLRPLFPVQVEEGAGVGLAARERSPRRLRRLPSILDTRSTGDYHRRRRTGRLDAIRQRQRRGKSRRKWLMTGGSWQ